MKCCHCRHEQPKPSQLLKLYHSQKHFMFHSSPLRTSIHKMILFVDNQSIMNMLTLLYFLNSRQQKQKIPAKFNKISSHRQCRMSGIHMSRCTYSKIYISVPSIPFWPCLHLKNTTSFSDLQRPFDLNMITH